MKITVVGAKTVQPLRSTKMPKAVKTLKDNYKNELLNRFETPDVIDPSSFKTETLVLVSTSWCPPCDRLIEFVLSTDKTEKLLKDYQLIYVDGDHSSVKSLKTHFPVFYYPTLIYFNRHGAPVSQLIGHISFAKLKNWLDESKKIVDDPIPLLSVRMKERQQKKWLRRLKDLFVRTEKQVLDEERWVNFLDQTAQYDQLVEWFTHSPSVRWSPKAAEARISLLWFGPKSMTMTRDEKELALDAEIASVFKHEYFNDLLTNTSDMGGRIIKKCKLKKGEPPFTQELCGLFAKKMEDHLKQSFEKDFVLAAGQEQLIAKASHYYDMAALKEQIGEEEASIQFYSLCFEEWSKLQSPLGERSRAIPIYQSNCLKPLSEKSSQAALKDAMKLFAQLLEFNPTDGIMWGRLANLQREANQYSSALASLEKGLQYSYGDAWINMAMTRVELLIDIKKMKEAKNEFLNLLEELSLEPDHNKYWWLQRLRSIEKRFSET